LSAGAAAPVRQLERKSEDLESEQLEPEPQFGVFNGMPAPV
jgi:hypothetical protein